MSASRLTEQLGHRCRDAMRTVVRCAAAIVKGSAASVLEAVQPLVARLPADGVAGTELRHREEPMPVIGDEAFALVHG
jgi:hypothetical protein